jgi:hypothetical protein
MPAQKIIDNKPNNNRTIPITNPTRNARQGKVIGSVTMKSINHIQNIILSP